MKKMVTLLSGLICLSSISACFAMPDSKDYKTIQEKIVFVPNDPNVKAPPTVLLTMGHKDGSKKRDFYLPKDSAYAEMRNLTRQHLTGNQRVGGYFVDELISKDKTYILILAGQVHESNKNGKKIFNKRGTWMDSLGHSGTWVDEVQEQNPTQLLAACGGQ